MPSSDFIRGPCAMLGFKYDLFDTSGIVIGFCDHYIAKIKRHTKGKEKANYVLRIYPSLRKVNPEN